MTDVRRLIAAVGLLSILVVACVAPGPPRPPSPPLPPVSSISQCQETFQTNPGGYTRPIPTNHPITSTPVASDYTGRVIMWLSRHCDQFITGSLDYGRSPGFCWFRADLGDRYYGDLNNGVVSAWIGPLPASCSG